MGTSLTKFRLFSTQSSSLSTIFFPTLGEMNYAGRAKLFAEESAFFTHADLQPDGFRKKGVAMLQWVKNMKSEDHKSGL